MSPRPFCIDTNMRPKRIANILRHAALGDVLYAEPMIRALKESKGYELINFHTWGPFGQILLNHPCLNEIKASEIGPNQGVIREIPYQEISYCLDFVYENEWRMGNEVYVPLSYIKHFNLNPPNPPNPLLFITDSERSLARSLLVNGRKTLAICPNGKALFKDEEWKQVVEAARAIGFFLVGIGTDNRQAMDLNIDMRGKTSIREMCLIMSEVDAVLTLESGSMVVADALGKPGVGLILSGHPSTMLKPESKIKPVPCHDHCLHYNYLCRPEVIMKLDYHLKVETIIASLREVASTLF